jgi:hypothetical protein
MNRIASTPWLISLLCTASWAQATAPDPALLGCWRAHTIVLHTADGAKLEDRSGRCTLQFKEEQLESTCRTTQGLATTTYRYQVVRPQVYATTLAASTVRTEMASATREYAYRIEGEQLHTETAPPAVAPAASAATARTETDATKVPCPEPQG